MKKLNSPEPQCLSTLKTVLAQDRYRWVAVQGISNRNTPDIMAVFQELYEATPEYLLIEEANFNQMRGGLTSSEIPWMILDALDLPHGDRAALRKQMKTFLKQQPKARFLVLTAESVVPSDLPAHFGKGLVLQWDGVSQERSDEDLLRHARKLTPKYGIGDLVLGPKTKLRFDEAINYIETREFCLNDWGFRKRHSRGHGVTLLFHGASGTGKTMAAEVVSTALGLPLYQIDLSSVVSKWVGETEKNLKSIFRAAEGVNGILLFDEGDAIFGTRTKVEDSQDKYSNLEVNYLLQELEIFDGVAILSTNHENNMDPAFLRRFTYSITFGRPDPDQRVSIWRANIPAELPVNPAVDFAALSRFALTGGNIRNCIRDAASRAAGLKKKAVDQVDFLWAIKRELQKHGQSIERELVGETFWREVAPEWEFRHIKEKAAAAKRN